MNHLHLGILSGFFLEGFEVKSEFKSLMRITFPAHVIPFDFNTLIMFSED
jgi:hypothetical protein